MELIWVPFLGLAWWALEEKAAAMIESILRNHALVDGNKRLGWLSLIVMLDLNGCEITVSDDEAYEAVISLATGQESYREFAAKVRSWRLN